MEVKLSEGCIQGMIQQHEKIENPTVQILSFEIRRGTCDIFFAVISDGVYFTDPPAILGPQARQLYKEGKLQSNSVVTVQEYLISKTNSDEGKITSLLIKRITVLKEAGLALKRIGNPKAATKLQISKFGNLLQSLSLKTLPIRALNPNNDKWWIKARIVNKSDVQKSSEEFFSMDLIDSSGSIAAKACNDACRKFYDLLKENEIFFFSRFTIRWDEATSNQRELILNENTKVVRSAENVPFKFCTFASLKDIPANSSIDIIGVCMRVSEMMDRSFKEEPFQGKVRYMRLTDDHMQSIEVMLWHDAAEKGNICTNPVVAFQNATLLDINGYRCAAVHKSCQIFVNPDIEPAHKLKMWCRSKMSGRKSKVL